MQYNSQDITLDPQSRTNATNSIVHESGGGNEIGTESHHAANASQRLLSEADHVKHRRTRSGCYTCRSRRVKCDESRPICERCRKGSRECVYPEPRPSTKHSAHSKSSQQKANVLVSESSSDEFESRGQITSSFRSEEPKIHRKPTQSISRHSSSKVKTRLANQVNHSFGMSYPFAEPADESKEKSLSPCTDSSGTPPTATLTPETPSSVSRNSSKDSISWSYLPEKLQFYLEYHSNHISYRSYFFKYRADHFLNEILLAQALAYEPLLFAVVGFAAFRRAFHTPDGKVEDFLGFYNVSIAGLRRSLEASHAHTESMLLTILQLATFEEYLGDWASLLGHQKAAYRMLLELYTPETIAQNEIRRQILSWYSRFDIFAGIMSGNETMLGREWFLSCGNFYREQSQKYPENMDYKIEMTISDHRLITIDMTLLFAKFSQKLVTIDNFKIENERLAERILLWKQQLDMLRTETKSSLDTIEAERNKLEDIIDPHMPGGFHEADLMTLNFMLMDGYAIDLVHRYQGAQLLQQQVPPELRNMALEICRMVEAVDRWSEKLPGALLASQALLGLATMFLPKDDGHVMWCRLKLARIEGMGYIYPPSFRLKMANLWGLPDVSRWWLPGDTGYPALVQSIRAFMGDHTIRTDDQVKSEAVANMKALLSNLNINDNRS